MPESTACYISQLSLLKGLIVPAASEQGLPAAMKAHVRENEKAPGTVLTFALGNEIPDIYREAQVNTI